MKRVCIACAAIAVCASLRLFAQSEAGYRANIGKAATNPTNGTEVGRIVDVALMNGRWVYKVDRAGKIVNWPVESVIPKKIQTMPSVPAPAPAAPPARIDPILQSTATEFRTRLERRHGVLQTLVVTQKGISAEWRSISCDAFEQEILDLLVSVKQTQKASPAISGSRTCFTATRTFALKGATFHDYRTGKIGDAQVLGEIK